MVFFNKKETKVIGGILAIILIASLFNFNIAYRRSRDNQRKNDLGDIVKALDAFNSEFGFYPLGTADGKIKGCGDFKSTKDMMLSLSDCEWGFDPLYTFMKNIPSDPNTKKSVNYFYLSDGKYFQILSHLEGKDENEYNLQVEARHIMCGKEICNFGKSSSHTPLDKSIEEYENELGEIKK